MNRLIIVFCFLFIFNIGFCQNKTFFKNIVEYLSSEQLAGRQIGTEGITASEKFIIKEYKKLGLKPFGKTNGLFVQEFIINDSIPNYKGIKCRNIIGIIDNRSDSTIIFSAHYDHIGSDTLLSKEIVASKRKKIHSGADDNASGVAMVLGLAKYLSCKKLKKYNYVFLNCSAHEIGLIGSKVFFESSFLKELKVKAIINIDMVGKLNPISKYLKIGGVEKNAAIKDFFSKEDVKLSELNFFYNDSQLLMSDATVFYKNGIPTYTFTTGTSEDYHKSSDNADKIDYNGMESIFILLQKFVFTISN